MTDKPIKKAFLYDDEATTEHLTYEEWAVSHIQDAEVAYGIACNMLADSEMRHDNWDRLERVAEVFTITDRASFIEQMNAFEDEDRQYVDRTAS